MPSPQSLDSESPPPTYHHHHHHLLHHYGHTPLARAAADGPGSWACDAGPQQPLLALVEQLGLKLDLLERDNAQLRADLQALTARQLDTDATVGRLRAQLAAATEGALTERSTTNTTTTTTTTTGEPAAKRSRRSHQAEVHGGGGASLAFQHHQAGEAGTWRSLLDLRRLMPFLDPYVLPDTFVPPDLRGPVLCTQVTTGGAAPPVFVFANSALCELFGCTLAEVIGQPLTSFVALDREKAARFAKTRSKTPLYVGPALPIRSLFRARSGQLWRADCSLHIFFDQHGDPKHVLNSLVRWEPGQLEGSEAFDQWTPVSELCKQLLISSHDMQQPHTPHAHTTPHHPTTPAGGGPDLFPPWLSAPGDLTLEGLSPSDYWTLL